MRPCVPPRRTWSPLSAQEVLAHVVDEFHPRLYVACSFQKEASVILDMLLAIEPAARVFTLDTGVLFQETYETWRRIEERYGIDDRPSTAASGSTGCGSATRTPAAGCARSSRSSAR